MIPSLGVERWSGSTRGRKVRCSYATDTARERAAPELAGFSNRVWKALQAPAPLTASGVHGGGHWAKGRPALDFSPQTSPNAERLKLRASTGVRITGYSSH